MWEPATVAEGSLAAVSAAGNLRNPPPLAGGALRVIPLGGLGDIGRNMAVLEYDGQLLVIDCGVLFPEDDHPGVDLILPGFDVIADRLDDIQALVLTHGHEDHIGAVPYLLRQRPDIPLVGSKLTLALLQEKIREHRIKGTVTRRVEDSERVTFGPFDLEFLAVNHSIPDALAVAVRTRAGLVLHTGDFKMDQLPLDGRITDLRAFARLGEEGVDLFMVDSTNAEVPGFTTPERDITPALDRVFATSRQRLIVACFASHVHRVQQVLDAAVAHGRKVVYVGRSMVRNMGVARDLGYLHVPADTLIELRDIGNYRPDEVAIISTGSQGEPLSALSRMANREHQVDPAHRGRHGRAGLLVDPGQRELGLPGDQRSDQAGGQRGAQGQRDGARVRPRQRRRAAVRVQHRETAQRDAGARRGPAPGRERRSGRGHRGATRSARSWPRTER